MKKRLFTLILACVMLLSLAACGSKEATSDPGTAPSTESNEVEYQETFTWVPHLVFKTFDTQNTTSGTSLSVYSLVFNNLLEFDTVENQLVPALAESWTQIDENTWEFKLRHGVKFHNGVEFTAADVEFTFNRGKEQGASQSKLIALDHVEVIDEYTIRTILTAPNSDFLYMLPDGRLSILCKEAFDTMPAEEANLIGTGPFMYDDWVPNDYLSLVRYDDYWAGPVNTKHFVVREIPEQAARLIALQNGEVDLIHQPVATDLHYISDDPSLQLVQLVGANLRYIGLNTLGNATADPQVRQAIARGINREEYNIVAYNGNSIPVDNMMHPNNEFYKEIDAIEYSPEEAKEILAKAGYSEGEITLRLLCMNNNDDLTFATLFQNQMKAIGINVEIIQEENTTFSTDINPGNTSFDAFVNGWGGFATGPDNALRTLFHSTGSKNTFNINESYIDERLDKAYKLVDKAERLKLYGEVEQYINDLAVSIPIAIENVNCGAKAGVEGIIPPNGSIYNLRPLCLPISK